MTVYNSYSEEETISLGKTIGEALPENAIVCLFGNLGAGKTTFVKGLAAGCSGCEMQEVTSPTYVYLNIYQGKHVVYHFDLYRLENPEDFIRMGFDDYLDQGGICVIEWAERIASLLPEHCLRIDIAHVAAATRTIHVSENA